MEGIQATQELQHDSEKEDPEEEIDNEVEDDPEQEVEEDPEEEIDNGEDDDQEEELEEDPEEEMDTEEEEDDPEEEIDNEEEDGPDDEMDNEEEDDPEEEEESSEGSHSELVKNELLGKSGGISDVHQPFKELDKEPKLESPLSCTAEDKSGPVKSSPIHKNCRKNSEYDCGSAASDQKSYDLHFPKPSNDGSSSVNQEGTGSSGKRRRSRWDQKPEESSCGESVEGGTSSKRRKTRWASTNSQKKLLGPLKLPDFTQESLLTSEFDTEMQSVRDELVAIDYKLQRPVLHDERPKEEQSPSPEPLYNSLGIRINTREARLRQKLIERRQSLITRLIKKQPTFKTPKRKKTRKLCRKLYIPVKQYPGYNFVGLIIGPQGNTQKRMEKETGAKIPLRGSGSFSRGKHASENDDLHVFIEANTEDSLDAAFKMVEKLLTPIDDKTNDHKQAQLKELAELMQSSKEKKKCYFCGASGHQYEACPHQVFSSRSVSGDAVDHNHTSGNGNTKSGGSSKHGKGTLYVSQLPGRVDDHLLKELFCPFGKLIEAKVIRNGEVGNSKGCGVVKFEDPNDAAVAASHLNGFSYEGNILAVKAAQSSMPVGSVCQRSTRPCPVNHTTRQSAWPGPPGSMLTEPQAPFPPTQSFPLEGGSCLNNGTDLFISNLPDSVDENRLKELFCPFGRVAEAKVVRNGNTGRSKGCGSVKFENPEDASMALLHLNGFEIEGRMLAVSRNSPNQTWPYLLSGSAVMEPKLPSPVFAGHGGLLPRGPSLTFTPPSTGSSSFDIHSMNSFGSSYTLSDQSPFSSLGYMAGFPGDPNYPISQFGAYFTTPDDRPSPASQLVHTPEGNIQPIHWAMPPRPS